MKNLDKILGFKIMYIKSFRVTCVRPKPILQFLSMHESMNKFFSIRHSYCVKQNNYIQLKNKYSQLYYRRMCCRKTPQTILSEQFSFS